MGVVKSKRTTSRLEVQHHFYKVRRDVTALVLRDFGYSPEKYARSIEQYRKAHANAPNIDEIVARWERKAQSFHRWFVDEEGRACIDLMREIQKHFSLGNSIYPSETHAKLMEYLTRRWHMNRAIGACYSLKQELQYVIYTLPTDVNKFTHLAEMIDEEIRLLKGIRQADNRFLRDKKNKGSLTDNVTKVFNGIAAIIREIGRMEMQ